MDIYKLFEKHKDDYLAWNDLDDAGNPVPSDLHAFMILNTLCPSKRCIVSASEHDKIYLSTNVEDLAAVAPEASIIELIRCGVMIDEETESLFMFT